MSWTWQQTNKLRQIYNIFSSGGSKFLSDANSCCKFCSRFSSLSSMPPPTLQGLPQSSSETFYSRSSLTNYAQSAPIYAGASLPSFPQSAVNMNCINSVRTGTISSQQHSPIPYLPTYMQSFAQPPPQLALPQYLPYPYQSYVLMPQAAYTGHPQVAFTTPQ